MHLSTIHETVQKTLFLFVHLTALLLIYISHMYFHFPVHLIEASNEKTVCSFCISASLHEHCIYYMISPNPIQYHFFEGNNDREE